jgi:hypothetical protein
MQLVIQLWEHLIPFPAELGAHAARSVIKTGMDNATVTLGSTLGHIIGRVQYQHRDFRLAQFSGNRSANTTSSNDNNCSQQIMAPISSRSWTTKTMIANRHMCHPAWPQSPWIGSACTTCRTTWTSVACQSLPHILRSKPSHRRPTHLQRHTQSDSEVATITVFLKFNHR